MLGMKRLLIILLFMGLMLHSASALTQLTLYVDAAGDALFLGASDETPVLPAGITLANGRIHGYTSTLTQKEGNSWTFSYALASSEMVIVLPEGAVIKSLSSGEITLEQGQIAVYVVNGTTIRYSIEKKETSNGIGAFVTIIGALIAIVVIAHIANYRNRGRRTRTVLTKRKKVHRLDVISSVLNERENLILEKLRETDKTKMSYLRKSCDLPKASFSRHIHELVKKKLVKLSGEGKNKFVELVAR